MIRVVLDTNIVVSAALRSGSLPEAVLNFALDGRAELCLSEAIFSEYKDVLTRTHLAIEPNLSALALDRIHAAAKLFSPGIVVAGCSDPDDNIFLECAEAAAADYLITGNQRHFPDRWKKTRVISAREFVEIIMEKKK
jgi:uncharacterized protein